MAGELVNARTTSQALSTATRTAGTPTKRVLTRARRLEVLKRDYCEDPAFSHLRYRTPITWGYGSITPKITILVEAPQTHSVNVVESIGYLNGPERVVVVDLLKSIDLAEEHIYYTGLVKYPLPGNREARPEEISASIPYLAEELDVIQARFVVVFGRHLVETLLPGADLIHHHGMLFESHRSYMPMFHPVAALYNKDIRAAIFRDFSRLNMVI
jgi:uracil-DNA glycosylase family 4